MVSCMEQDATTAWIAERAKCNMRSLFTDFHSLVEQHVNAMQAECKRRGWETNFSHESYDHCSFRVQRRRPGTHFCTFRYDPADDVITVSTNGAVKVIRTRWDAEASQCKVIISQSRDPLDTGTHVEFPHDPLWKVAQAVLEPFFFAEVR